MNKIANNVLELIGNTPLVRIGKLASPRSAIILGKLESLNPGGTVKDRVALAMVEEAENRGKLKPGDSIVEASSGDIGIGLALVAAARGYQLVLAMPDTVEFEHRRLLMAYGARVVLTPAAEGMGGAIRAAEQIAANNPGHFMTRHFQNRASLEVHGTTTAREILEATGCKVDAFVSGVGTAGTLMGVGTMLKREAPGVLVIAVEPERSPLLSRGRSGAHGIRGMGANFVPPLLDRKIIDRIVTVSDDDAYETTALLGLREGLLVGVASGANMFASLKVAEELGPGKVVVTMLPERGERHLGLTLGTAGATRS